MDKKPMLDSELVNQFVKVAHSDLEAVTQLLDLEPMLINASWDWGGGDWETGLGAAAHMGCRDIALYLLQRGAHIDLYAAAMLGKIEIVKAILDDIPQAQNNPGAHGIPLMAHAKQGGDDARIVVDYLMSLGEE